MWLTLFWKDIFLWSGNKSSYTAEQSFGTKICSIWQIDHFTLMRFPWHILRECYLSKQLLNLISLISLLVTMSSNINQENCRITKSLSFYLNLMSFVIEGQSSKEEILTSCLVLKDFLFVCCALQINTWKLLASSAKMCQFDVWHW